MHVPVAFSSKCEHDLCSWFSFWEGGRVKHGTSQLSSDPSLAHHPVEAGDHGDANAYPWLQVRDKWHGTPRQTESFGKTTWHGLQQGPDWNANTTLNPNRACWWTCQTDRRTKAILQACEAIPWHLLNKLPGVWRTEPWILRGGDGNLTNKPHKRVSALSWTRGT